MILKRVLTGVAALVLGLSLSQAQANFLVVDDFTNLGPIPTTSANTWGYAGATDAVGGARDFTKNNGGQAVFGGGGGKATLTTTTAGSVFQVRYDGTAGTSTTYLNPRLDISTYSGYLCVLTPDVAVTGSTTATATLQWSESVGAGIKTSALTLTGGPTLGGYLFKISDFSNTITTNGLKNIASIDVRLAGLGGSTASPGLTSFNKIFFTNTAHVPEPGTFALAALGVVGLVVARRKTRA